MEARNIAYRFHTLDFPHIDPDLLDTWLDAFGWLMLIDRRTAEWRHRPFDPGNHHNRSTVRELLWSRPGMLKTPIIEAGENWLLGWNAPNKVCLLGLLQNHHRFSGRHGLNDLNSNRGM